MKPTDAVQALTAVLHKVREVDHEWAPGCCAAEPLDRLEADDLNEALSEFDWMVQPRLSLPTEAPKGREGKLDLTRINGRVLEILTLGPLSTWALCTIYQQRSADRVPGYAKRAFDTPRKRLADLERVGYARPTGETVK